MISLLKINQIHLLWNRYYRSLLSDQRGRRKKTSSIWKYFAAIHHSSPDYGKNKVVCLLCRDLGKNYVLHLSCSKPSPTPLHNHVQTKHFDTFENYKVAEVQQKKGS
jgi:hypothetical protein